MRKLFGFLFLLSGVAAYLYYVQGWDWQRLKRTRAVSFVLREDASATTTPIGSRGVGTHWEAASPMPEPREDAGVALIGDTIYVIGGVDGYARSLSSVVAYDIMTDTWRETKRMPQPINHPAVATDGSKIYVLGGFTGLAARPLDSAYVYDPATDAWAEFPRLNDFRGGAGAAMVDGRVYVVGGQTGAGVVGVLEYYEIETHFGWNGLQYLPTPRGWLQAVTHDGKIYVLGGDSGPMSKDLGTTEVYDPKVDGWKSLPDMSVPRSAFAAVSSGGLIYAFGGESASGTVETIETLDPKKGTWSTFSLPMSVPRHGLSAVAWKDRIYLLGGGRRAGFSVNDLNTVLILDRTPVPAPTKK